MKTLKTRKALLFLFVGLSLVLTACAPTDGEEPSAEESHTLIYATMSGNINRGAVDKFNRNHSDIQIEVKDYSEDGRVTDAGIKRLLTEITVGQIPDIIEPGNSIVCLPIQQLAQKGYLEDLWPYIENDPEIGRENIVEVPLSASEIDGKLYTAFSSVYIDTLVGAEHIVGNRYSWSLDDLRSAFSTMPEGSTVLEYFFTKADIFAYVFSMNLEHWIDWETGECSFKSDEFRDCLEFINSFPLEFEWHDVTEINQEAKNNLLTGRQMLTSMWTLSNLAQIQAQDVILGDKTAFVGYPVSDGSVGSCFWPASMELAMTSTCRNKEAAWEFIREIFLPGKYGAADMGIPVNRESFDQWLNKGSSKYGKSFYYGSMEIELHQTTSEEKDRFLDFFNSIDKFRRNDLEVYNIAKEQCGAYFSGDKTLDETVDLIQRRVSLYVNEMR